MDCAVGSNSRASSAGLAYANVAFSGAVSICLLSLLGSAVRGTGNMGLPAGVIVGSVIAHVLISPVLIFGWGPVPALGPAGAGWGLIIPFGAGSLVLVAYLRSARSLVTLPFRGVALRWSLFAEILKVGVPGLINVTINNLSVVLLTGIAGRLGREVAIGYAMGARLEYILIPLAFGFGTAIVAMVGTNWGAKQYDRAYKIAWTGGATVGAACALIGVIVALFPGLWMGLFTGDSGIIGVGASYLHIVGPIYGFYGLAMALYSRPKGLAASLDRRRQRRAPTHKHRMRPDRYLLAPCRCDRLLRVDSRGVLRLRGCDLRRDIQGEEISAKPMRCGSTRRWSQQMYTVVLGDAVADRLSVSDATLTDLNRTLAMMGIAHWTHGGAGTRWRAVTQAQLGVRKGPIITPNIRPKVDRGRFRRGITLIGEFRRVLRDLIPPAKAKWT
jgi:hypothetical protein